ncbi:hypothetical protein [Streptomyces sp. NPDC002990]
MAAFAAHICGECDHPRGVHARSLGTCLGAPGGLGVCGCTRFWWKEEPKAAPGERSGADPEPADSGRSWWEKQQSGGGCGGCGE